MEQVGIYNDGNVYQTKAGNYIAEPKEEGRKADIKENADGTYHVTVTNNGKVEMSANVTEEELVTKFAADVERLGINVGETNSAEEAQNKYGEQVANNFYAVA